MYGPPADPSKWIDPPGNLPAWIRSKRFTAAIVITATVFAILLAWAACRTWRMQ